MKYQWTPEELEALKVQGRPAPALVLNSSGPLPRVSNFTPTTQLRWYQAPMTPESGKVLQQRWVDMMTGEREWREIETVDES